MFRIEYDTLGKVKVPKNVYWGAQTERSRNNFKIGEEGSMPKEIIKAFAYIKKSAAYANYKLKILSKKKRDLISKVCDEILEDKLNDQFPLVIWQTGSGTQSNMNINEVISNRALVLDGGVLGEKSFIHPNDDVNKSQSSNDTFSTAMNIASYTVLINKTLPAIEKLKNTLKKKSEDFRKVIKIGRTHLMDAVPLTLGQEFSAYVAQLEYSIKAIKNTLVHLSEIALGGTAIGTGLNAPKGYSELTAMYISKFTGLPFITAPNKFEAIANHDAIIESHGSLKQLAVALYKIANDIRYLGSGPRAGIGEIFIPENEPGSSIMPGKSNPTQNEALTMVCAQVLGNDTTISFSGANGQYQLNTFKPVIIFNFLQSAKLLTDACISFNNLCIINIKVNYKRIEKLVNNSLMLVTILNTKIGYENAAKIAKNAHKNDITLKESAINLGLVTNEEFEDWVRPEKMI